MQNPAISDTRPRPAGAPGETTVNPSGAESPAAAEPRRGGRGSARGANRNRRQRRKQVLAKIADGAELCQAVKAEFGDAGAPSVRRLVQLHRQLIYQRTSEPDADAESLRLADQLLRTVIAYESAQARIQQKQVELDQAGRKLEIAEQRTAKTDVRGGAIADEDLTPEECEARIREIYGR